jgi:hypothetical protein
MTQLSSLHVEFRWRNLLEGEDMEGYVKTDVQEVGGWAG